jgi:Tol biopolymer transport system component
VLYQSSDAHISSPEWNHDGTKLMFDSNIHAGALSTLQVIDRATGVRATLLSMPESEGRFVSGSWARQGSDRVAYHFWDRVTGDEPAIYTLDTSTPGQTPEFVAYGTEPTFSPDNSKIAFFPRDLGARGTHTYNFATGAIELVNRKVGYSDWRR